MPQSGQPAFVDLHLHLLPGVDDGPGNLDGTVAMLRLAHDSGTRRVVTTPHMYSPHFAPLAATRIRERFAEMIDRLRLGAENYLCPEMLEAAQAKEILALNDSRYLLVERPYFLPSEATRRAMELLLAAGYLPLLAHVERYETFRQRPEELASLIELGCLAQVNAASVSGMGGREERRLALDLLDRGLVQIIASDGHDLEFRPPTLEDAAAALRSRFPEWQVTAWLCENPARISRDEPVTTVGTPQRGPSRGAGRPLLWGD
jgi:protein-tyrosine phosphatase